MKNDSIYFCSLKELNEKKYIIKFFDTIKNELIIFKDKFQKIKIFSSICPHFGGEIFFNVNQRKLQCKWHGWKFDINTGNSVTNFNMYKKNSIFNKILKLKSNIEIGCFPNKGKLKEYNHVIENNKIFIVYENC